MGANLVFNSLAELQKQAVSTPGGLNDMYYVPVEDVSYIGPLNPLTGTIGRFAVVPGARIYKLASIPKGKAFTETPQQGRGGTYYDIVVSGFIPFESEANHVQLSVAQYYRYIVIAVSHQEGIVRIIGSIENPARISNTFSTGSDYSEAPGTVIQFGWHNEEKAPLWVPAHGSGPGAPLGEPSNWNPAIPPI